MAVADIIEDVGWRIVESIVKSIVKSMVESLAKSGVSLLVKIDGLLVLPVIDGVNGFTVQGIDGGCIGSE